MNPYESIPALQCNIKRFSSRLSCPPLFPAAQEKKVTGIEAEPAPVAANRGLIGRFEKKIQAMLARVRGEAG